jgi:hypothetical protein
MFEIKLWLYNSLSLLGLRKPVVNPVLNDEIFEENLRRILYSYPQLLKTPGSYSVDSFDVNSRQSLNQKSDFADSDIDSFCSGLSKQFLIKVKRGNTDKYLSNTIIEPTKAQTSLTINDSILANTNSITTISIADSQNSLAADNMK